MMFEEVHTFRHTWITENVVFYIIFSRNRTLEKRMIQIGVQLNLSKKSKK